jgi:hypothetical protein
MNLQFNRGSASIIQLILMKLQVYLLFYLGWEFFIVVDDYVYPASSKFFV